MDKIIIAIFSFLLKNRLSHKIKRLYHRSLLPTFFSIGTNTIIFQPFYCGTADLVKIGNYCRIGIDSEFGVVRANSSGPKIIIGNNVWVTARLQIFAKVMVEIADDVIIAANVFICDYSHGYSKIDIPYQKQSFEPFAPVYIGKGTWIGQNCVILFGVTIGEQCIIGANSVVTKSIPDKCIAIGSPAKVIKIWDDAL